MKVTIKFQAHRILTMIRALQEAKKEASQGSDEITLTFDGITYTDAEI